MIPEIEWWKMKTKTVFEKTFPRWEICDLKSKMPEGLTPSTPIKYHEPITMSPTATSLQIEVKIYSTFEFSIFPKEKNKLKLPKIINPR